MELMLANLPLWVACAIMGVLGAAMGSFISLISYRLPLEEPIGLSRSRCPSCLHVLGVKDLVPVLSWVLSRGRCRYCGTKVSIRYPLLELACALGAVALIYVFGVHWISMVYVALWWAAVALFITDLEHYIILDELQIALLILGVLHGVVAAYNWQDMALGAATGLGIGLALKYGFLLIARKDGLGLGDVKFLLVAGVWLAEPAAFVPFLFFAGLMGVVTAGIWRAIGKGEVFPFGPALMASLLACVYYTPVASDFWRLYGFLQH